jgi:hypothetical protein
MPNGPTAWWRWTPASTGSVRLRTWGSERANLLAVYRGSSLDTLRLVGFASSFNGRANSADVSFSATAGETYHIQVLGADYSNPFYINSPVLPSRIQLSLEPYETGTFVPANDAFAAATPMPGNGPLLVCTTNATAETSDLNYAGFGAFAPKVPSTYFATVATGMVNVPTDVPVEITADDGLRFYIDDLLVIADAWKYQGPTVYRATIPKGSHRLRIEHFQIDGYAALQLRVRL